MHNNEASARRSGPAAAPVYPHSMVWSPIPLITWLLPFIGHMGITDSEGRIHDFGGPYYVNKSKTRTAFGPVAKVWTLDLAPLTSGKGMTGDRSEALRIWDAGVNAASGEYENRMHNLFWDNCHNHVAMALGVMGYVGFWNMVTVWLRMLLRGRYVSWGAIVRTYLPSVLIYSVLLFVLCMPQLLAMEGAAVASVAPGR